MKDPKMRQNRIYYRDSGFELAKKLVCSILFPFIFCSSYRSKGEFYVSMSKWYYELTMEDQVQQCKHTKNWLFEEQQQILERIKKLGHCFPTDKGPRTMQEPGENSNAPTW